ncbi:MAG: MarR family winged helix-turn-helix transcriptional regulator [Solirubrobacteraceae bacterium]
MHDASSTTYRFGDLLALAREYWVRQMTQQLAAAGFSDYRRSDAVAVRMLARRPRSVGELGEALGITRQAARKLVTGLERRGYATTARDEHDARRLNIVLSARGQSFAAAIVEAIELLNQALAERVDAAQLLAADSVLRASLPDQRARNRAARLIPPPT